MLEMWCRDAAERETWLAAQAAMPVAAVSELAGRWHDVRDPAEITTIEYDGQSRTAIVATNAAQFWSPAKGAMDGRRVSMFGLTGELGEDGSSIAWSNNAKWIKAAAD